jgi:branched-chain amino acid transport system permease protein
MALGLNIILKTGQVSLAHAAFMAIGAYASAQLTVKLGLPFLVGFFLAGLLSAAVALALGRTILRLKGVYFILFTFALNEFIFLLSKDATPLTGGNTGITGIKAPMLPFIDGPLQSKAAFYYFALAVFLAVVALLAVLYRSPLGRAMDAVRESELLAESTGYNSARIKLIAFVIGSFIAGIGGSLFAHFLRYIAPFNFTFWESVNFLLMNIIGGSFSLAGPIIGAFILTPLPELLRDYLLWQQVFYGVILILFMRFLPDGVVSIVKLSVDALADWRRATPANETVRLAPRPVETQT